MVDIYLALARFSSVSIAIDASSLYMNQLDTASMSRSRRDGSDIRPERQRQRPQRRLVRRLTQPDQSCKTVCYVSPLILPRFLSPMIGEFARSQDNRSRSFASLAHY